MTSTPETFQKLKLARSFTNSRHGQHDEGTHAESMHDGADEDPSPARNMRSVAIGAKHFPERQLLHVHQVGLRMA